MSADLQAPMFIDEDEARKTLEATRWPDGPVCPHCGSQGKIGAVTSKARPGLYYCGDCGKQFTVTVGTVFERSHVPLTKWWLAVHLLSSSKKGMSAHQLHRMLGVTYKTAWFMAHRIREAMLDTKPGPMGGFGVPVQADETYIGRKDVARKRGEQPGKKGTGSKMIVVGLVSGGKARTFHVANAKIETVTEILRRNVARASELQTDESLIYVPVGGEFMRHRTVRHSEYEYVGEHGQTVNACENYFSIFKRDMKGVYQHCSEKHLARYLTEFDFRYNYRVKLGFNDADRATAIAKGIEGKRLTYRRTGEG
jgi:transposase-like protein